MEWVEKGKTYTKERLEECGWEKTNRMFGNCQVWIKGDKFIYWQPYTKVAIQKGRLK